MAMGSHPPETALSARQEEILALTHRDGFVAIEALAQRFQVTVQTARRDINRLCGLGLLKRYHGGAGLASSVENVAYAARRVMYPDEKRRIAALLAHHIPNDASLFINIGTTTEEVARLLTRRQGLRIITNNLNVAWLLRGNPDQELILAGGTVRARDGGITGEATLDFVSQFKVDFAVLGISGIDLDGSLLDFDYHEVRVSRAMLANARRVFLAADHSKFGRHALVRLGHLSCVDALFTDRKPPAAYADLLEESGVALHVAARALEPAS